MGDKALQRGRMHELVHEISSELISVLRKRSAATLANREHASDSVATGRDYVARYVELMHYIERLHQAGTDARIESAVAEHH